MPQFPVSSTRQSRPPAGRFWLIATQKRSGIRREGICMRSLRRLLFVLTCVVIPSAAHAQGSITGVVKDASGAVLPGVTVDASSPSLIERTRTVVSDGTGQYRLIDLRPGVYVVTFTLNGFSTVKRE